MQINPKYQDDDLIDLNEIFSLLWNKKSYIGLIAIFFMSSSFLYSILAPNIYTSYSLLASTSSSNSLSSSMRSYSAIAGLAGVNLPKDSDDKSLEAIARIESYDFFSKYFLPNIKLENLLALDSWDKEKNKIFYDTRKFDPLKKNWNKRTLSNKETIPSKFLAYEEYKKILSISQDSETLFISISIDHLSPYIAKKWLNIIIHNINESMRAEEKVLTLKYIDFLNTTISDNRILEIETTILSLLKDQMQKLMLVSANDDYVFKQIEPPIVPEKKSAHIIFIILGLIIGIFSAILIILIQHYFLQENRP